MSETNGVAPSDKIEELISSFLREAARADNIDDEVKTLVFLIKALRII